MAETKSGEENFSTKSITRTERNERIQMIFQNGLRKLVALSCFLSFPLTSYSSIHFSNVTARYRVKGYNYVGGHGVCWVDVNGDGKLDIYIKNVGGSIYPVPNHLFINYGDYFIEEAKSRGVSDAHGYGTHGAVFADLDNDGDLDLFSTTTFVDSPSRNHIYKNNGNGFFSDITNSISPPQQRDTSARGVAAADFDRDGDVDLYFSNPLSHLDPSNPLPFPPKKLENFYMNKGNGTFSTQHRGISWTGFVQGVVAIDIDGDGDVDIAEARWTPPSTVYLNNGNGNFRDAGREMGLPSTLGVHDNGLTFGDVDNDGDMDLAVTGEGRVALYRNIGGFFNLYDMIEIERAKEGFHTSFGDFDHDCDLDLYISGDNVYKNNGNGHFTLVPAKTAGLHTSITTYDPRGCALGDFDNDGDLDIYVTDKRGYNQLFRNDCNDSNWIQVIINDQAEGPSGIGTKLDLYLADYLGKPKFLKGHREVLGEYGYLGQDMSTIHFGAPASDQYDLKVTFFDGKEKVIQNINPGNKIFVTYPLFPAPLNFTAVRQDNEILLYQESMILLTWEANPQNKNIKKYRIYEISNEGQALLVEVSADTFSYLLRNTEKDREYRFALTAVDHKNREGDATYATVN